MTLNMSEMLEESVSCSTDNMTSWEHSMEKMYTYFYLLLFIPGLLLNTTALYVLCRHISKKTKAVIFMINLAAADLAHILSLPLRIYYYFTHTWPFGRSICLFCFYLKYLNMYAAIVFLVCISMQRCVFLLDPFAARRWRRRYDLLISVVVWLVVSLACSPFILMRTGVSGNNVSDDTQTFSNLSVSVDATSTQHSSPTTQAGCFKDLPMRRLPPNLAVTMMALAELFGFIIPLTCISYSSIRIAKSLNQRQSQEQQNSTARLNPAAHSRLQSITSNCQNDGEKQTSSEKGRALQMVLGCMALFWLCFAPYHINFMFYLMVSQKIITHCPTRLAVNQFHPVSLCLASMSCCLNPLLYYFLTAEFRMHLTRRTSSISSSVLSSPITSPTQLLAPQRLISMESNCSDRDQH
ncbi:putative P2Y purinoceptor 10 isoform X2 [Echeneis naucrates]|uniref:putative P2Y purinoceptor 10 isoform X2 n=1 Tax=Echeneis naucrates TaxID=173247 RepID=UPI0011137092|nr:putative P2Y purinoceptor 10 isoform X2 [Echeneis naucrates]